MEYHPLYQACKLTNCTYLCAAHTRAAPFPEPIGICTPGAACAARMRVPARVSMPEPIRLLFRSPAPSPNTLQELQTHRDSRQPADRARTDEHAHTPVRATAACLLSRCGALRPAPAQPPTVTVKAESRSTLRTAPRQIRRRSIGDYNAISGSLPTELGQLTSLQAL